MLRSLQLSFLIYLWLLPVPNTIHASEIERLLAGATPPEGVVFEIVEDDFDDLTWAIPQTRSYIERLRQRFPGLDIAVVSHGAEMFALKHTDRKLFLPMHQQVESLHDQGVDMHVCGTYAQWQGDDTSDFPAYVDVAPSGPAQINQYLEMGYTLIRIDEP
ncbi:MAG: DsrE family protein [Gammaproteobacteria bacterium]|nr:DsrE family protein [Gammaproteobacteria bacterium]